MRDGRRATKVWPVLLVLGLALATTGLWADAPAGWKEATLDRMAQAESEIVTVRQALASNPGDAYAAERLDALQAELENLSASMGGDRPVHARREEKGEVTPPAAFLPPPTCTAATSTFTNAIPLAIPTGPAVVSSTLTVAGAGTFLWDLNLTTFLTHTFAADLDITLQSPAGTIVTLTTDNGAGNDNVFNGTVWDDSANPGGQVPYTANNGVVTDHTYANLTLASPLVPEEAFSAFYGEDPNGTWTITISDDLAGDGGSLDSWTLDLTTFTGPPTVTTFGFTNATPVAIPTGPGVVTSTLTVSGAGTSLSMVALTTFLTHTFAADLDITLQSPAGTIVTLTTDNGAGNDNVFNGTVWDDSVNPGGQVPYTTNNGMVTDNAYVNLTLASPLVPEESFGAFMGEDPNGTWTITISDDLAGDGGSLDSWTLSVTTATCVSCPAITITPATLPDATVGVPYNQVLVATGGTGPYTFAVTGGALPPGLTLASDGTLSGTPTTLGSYSFTVTATDAALCTGTQSYTMTVCPVITLAPASLPGGTVGGAYPTQTITASGGTAPYTFAVTAGSLPPGLTLAPDGTLSGTPSGAGTFTFTVVATDANGCTGSVTYTVVIAAFDLNLFDDYSRSQVCLNSFTGAFSWTVLRGPGMGTYTGTGVVTRQNGVLYVNTPPGVPWLIKLQVLERYFKASGSFSHRVYRFNSTLYDTNTLNNPPGC